MTQEEWTERVRTELIERVGHHRAADVEDDVEGFCDWWSDGASPAETAEAALQDAGYEPGVDSRGWR